MPTNSNSPAERTRLLLRSNNDRRSSRVIRIILISLIPVAFVCFQVSEFSYFVKSRLNLQASNLAVLHSHTRKHYASRTAQEPPPNAPAQIPPSRHRTLRKRLEFTAEYERKKAPQQQTPLRGVQPGARLVENANTSSDANTAVPEPSSAVQSTSKTSASEAPEPSVPPSVNEGLQIPPTPELLPAQSMSEEPAASAEPSQDLGPDIISFANITLFTRLRNSYFNMTDITNPSNDIIKIDPNSNVPDDLAVFSKGQRVPPFRVGISEAEQSYKKRNDLILNGREGFTYNQRAHARIARYKLILRPELNAFRHRGLARVPKVCRQPKNVDQVPWLLEFNNVWMTGMGEIYVPIKPSSRSSTNEWDVHAYQMQGGVVVEHWGSVKRKRIAFRRRRACKSITKIAFSVAQNHGATYYHVMAEIVPRLLTFWDVARAVISVDGGKIVGRYSGVVRSMLHGFGVRNANIAMLGPRQPCFFKKLFVPAPYIQGVYNDKFCLQRVIGRIQGQNVVGRAHIKPVSKKPVIVLIERAFGRNKQLTRCREKRCMANFHQLRKAILNEFEDKIELIVLSARDGAVMRKGVEAFSKATVVVGVHGAGFANIMFMRGKGTYAIHLGWRTTWQLYAKMADQFGVDFINVLTRGASQNGANAFADIPVIILELRRIFRKEGIPIPPPKIRTYPLRNAMVVMRLPKAPSRLSKLSSFLKKLWSRKR